MKTKRRRVAALSPVITLLITSTYRPPSLTVSSLQADVLWAVLRRGVAQVRVGGRQGFRTPSTVTTEV